MTSHQTTSEQTLMHILNSNIGTGILAMPIAINYVGFIVGFFGIPIVGAIATHCLYTLVRCQQIILKRGGSKATTYEQVAEYAVQVGPVSLRRFSKSASGVVSLFVLVTQFGVCSVYALFVAENLRAVAINLSLFGEYSMVSVRFYLLSLYPVMAMLCWTSSLRRLAYVSTIANILQITGLAVICYNLSLDLPHSSTRPLFTSITGIPLYISTVVFAFEGICVVMPVYTAMQKTETFLGMSGVLNTAMTLVTCLYVAVGFYGYLKFGTDVAASITLNLPSEPLYECVRIMFALAVLLSCPLQMLVAINFFWPMLERSLPAKWPKRNVVAVDLIYRSSLVAITFLLAAVVPMLDLIISLVGALCSSTIALIFPPFIQLIVMWPERENCSYWSYLMPKNVLVAGLGIFGMISGTYYSSVVIANEIRSRD